MIPTFGLNPSESIKADPPHALRCFPRDSFLPSCRTGHEALRAGMVGAHCSRERKGHRTPSRRQFLPGRIVTREPTGEDRAFRSVCCPSAAPNRPPLSISTGTFARGRPKRLSRVPGWEESAPNSTLGIGVTTILELDGIGSFPRAPCASVDGRSSATFAGPPRFAIEDRRQRVKLP